MSTITSVLLFLALVVFIAVASNKWKDRCCQLLGLGLALWVAGQLVPLLPH